MPPCAQLLLTLGILTVVAASSSFVHPGLLHTTQDLTRMRKSVAAGLQPWTQTYGLLTANKHSSLQWKPSAVATVLRGTSVGATSTENYSQLYNDAAAAYALALRWQIEGNDAYADTAVTILNAWTSTLTKIDGTSDKYLACGLYGYQLANAAELLRGYAKWSSSDFTAFVNMMLKVFYPMNHDFLTKHNGAKIDHYWANWDLANMATMLSIGILADRPAIFDEAVTYFKTGKGNGAIQQAVWIRYNDGTGQIQESGRDQGHSTLDIALLGMLCQMAYNQHMDLFAYDNNRVLAGAEYVAKYNLGLDVNFTTYKNGEVTQTTISSTSRGDIRPMWEVLYNHYVVLKQVEAPYITAWAEKVRPEGGGGDYSTTSGGFDQLGYGSLTYSKWKPTPGNVVKMLALLKTAS